LNITIKYKLKGVLFLILDYGSCFLCLTETKSRDSITGAQGCQMAGISPAWPVFDTILLLI